MQKIKAFVGRQGALGGGGAGRRRPATPVALSRSRHQLWTPSSVTLSTQELISLLSLTGAFGCHKKAPLFSSSLAHALYGSPAYFLKPSVKAYTEIS